MKLSLHDNQASEKQVLSIMHWIKTDRNYQNDVASMSILTQVSCICFSIPLGKMAQVRFIEFN